MSSILIIEDDNTLRDMYAAKFTHENFTVNTATDGQEGLEKIKLHKPDLVLLDLFMTNVSGFDVLRTVRNDPELKNIPILVFSNVSVDVEDLLKNWGATDFILKANATPAEAVQKVNQILAKQS